MMKSWRKTCTCTFLAVANVTSYVSAAQRSRLITYSSSRDDEDGKDGIRIGRRKLSSTNKVERLLSSLPFVNDYTVPSRNRTLALMRLNVAAYPSCNVRIQHGHPCSFPEGTMSEIFDKGLSVFGPNVASIQEELDATQSLNEEIWNSSVVGNSMAYRAISVPEDTAEFQLGVEALEWIVENTTILTFRGTFTDGDYANIENWMIDYILEQSTDRMKQAWARDAGLEWTKEMTERSKVDDRWAKLEIRAGESYILGRNKPLKEWFTRKQPFTEALVDAVAQNSTLSAAIGGLTLNEAKESGYWKLTKYVVDQVARTARENNRTLVLTGHSQGGTRAQLASMYLYKTAGIAHPTVTFAATGGSCVARLMFDSNANVLDDVDPFIKHEKMVEYVHPLDPWGNSMLGMDNGDRVCFWGKMDAQAAEVSPLDGTRDNHIGAYYYCSKVYGWPGPVIIAAESGLSGNEQLKENFQRCRYFTHTAETILLGLERDLLEDGTTYGGCYEIPIIPKDDPDQICPRGEISRQEEEAEGFIILIALLGVCCCLMIFYTVYLRFCYFGHENKFSHVMLPGSDCSDAASDDDLGSVELPELV